MGSRNVHRAFTGNAKRQWPVVIRRSDAEKEGWSYRRFSFCVGCFGVRADTDKVIALRCGSLFDGRGDSLRKNVVVVIEGEKIKDVARSAPGDAEIVDLSRETCLPGLIDTHTHILLQGDITAADYDAQLLKQSPEYRTILATVNARRARGMLMLM